MVSWNILSQSTLSDAQHDFYWEIRLPGILKFLEDSNTNFIFLQEVDLEYFEKDFAQLLKKYQYLRHKLILTGKNKRTNTFGNVILWNIGQLSNSLVGSRSLHVELKFEKNENICLTNVHFPAKPGLEGYKEKSSHLLSCAKFWKDKENCIFGGDFNDGLSYKDKDGKIAGLALDVQQLGFSITDDEIKKQTCKSFRGTIYNVDHILVRGNIKSRFCYDSRLDINSIPNQMIPSDHLPIYYSLDVVEISKELTALEI